MTIKDVVLIIVSCSILSFSPLAADNTTQDRVDEAPSFSALLHKFQDQKQSVSTPSTNKAPLQTGACQKKGPGHAEPFLGHHPVKIDAQTKAETSKKDAESGIKSNPMLLRHPQENFLIRETMIDECVAQCIILKSPKLTNGELTAACLRLYPLYDRRRDFNLEKGLQDKSCENVCSLWWFSKSSRENNERDSKGSRFRHDLVDISIDPVGQYWYDLVCKIKENILESMEMYEGIYGKPHPRKDEYRQAITATVNTVQMPGDEPLKQERKAPPSNSLTVRKQLENYAIREAMIDECINQYHVLSKKDLKKGGWIGACKKLSPLYEKRKEYIQEKNVDYETLGPLTGVASIFRHIDYAIRTTSESRFNEKMEYFNLSMEAFFKFKADIRSDVLESMEMYETFHGRPHPRKAEFLKM